MPSKKTDNQSLASKIALRRWLLQRMGMQTVRVLDTCSGSGHVWRSMRAHCHLERWTRCDIKPRQVGMLEMTATQAVRTLPLDAVNVVDIDPYGEPWEPYRELLQRLASVPSPGRVAVFLTHGHVNRSGTIATSTREALGIPRAWPIPRSLEIVHFVAKMALESTWRYAVIEHAACVRLPRVTYYALGLRPPTEKERNRGRN